MKRELRKGYKSMFGLLIFGALLIVNAEERVWTSVDGRTITAEGLSVSLTSVKVKREASQVVEIPFESLSRADVEFATTRLPLKIHDDVSIKARTSKQQTDRFERETGDYALSISGFSYGSGTFSGTGTISAITETVRESGRSVLVELSSFSGDGLVAIELYSIVGQGSDKKI
ncbi:MAG: hypothetical protein AAF236_14885, partial [Verrucomicrobiota bacterium]